MNINDIMERDFREAEKTAAAHVVEIEKPSLSVGAIIMLVAVALSMLACAYTFGYWTATKDDLDRQREQDRKWAEQDARIAAEVRAMSNADLIAATERDAAKYKTTK